jgi:disulfide bond formation protein DsbB
MNQNKLHYVANNIGLFFICIVLSYAFSDQLLHHDLPCPLCLLQRICLGAVGICFCMNIRIGIKTAHYGLMSLAALLGIAVASRQVYLHIMPGDPGYGDIFLNLHMYTWSLISFSIILVFIAIGLLLEQGFNAKPLHSKLGVGLMVIFLVLMLCNTISTVLECGFFICPDNPTIYNLIRTSV